jgi:hypothetical protein
MVREGKSIFVENIISTKSSDCFIFYSTLLIYCLFESDFQHKIETYLYFFKSGHAHEIE